MPTWGTAVPKAPRHGSSYDPDDYTEVTLAKAWSINGDSWQGIAASADAIQSGFYSVSTDGNGRPVLNKMDISVDSLIELPDPATDMLFTEFIKFWDAAAKVKALGLSQKRGILMYGPPGSGKTSLIQKVASHMINEMNGVVVMADNPAITGLCLHMLRRIEPGRPVITIYEDIDALVEKHGEAEFLSLLDGERQITNVVNVATTNYPERLDKRFVDRPGRFDRVQEVGMPSAEARGLYLKTRIPEISKDDLALWVRKSEDWSIAHLRELVMSTQALGESPKEAIQRLDDMRCAMLSSDGNGGSRKDVGF